MNKKESKSNNEHNKKAESLIDNAQVPQISLPKGGGALKGIDEKFKVNNSNGTCSLSIPIPISKSRSDFLPQLFLGYNSGNGNGSFGLGWNVELSSIQRKTDKKLPEYKDEDESDVFSFTGVEDLVPALRLKEGEELDWEEDKFTEEDGTEIKAYKPRIEGSFSRIERIKKKKEIYWKVTTKDNITTFYGFSTKCRIFDINDPARIFKWLPEVSYDNKGNVIEYEYISEDMKNVPNVLHEKNRRNGSEELNNKYLSKVNYGNKNPYYANMDMPFNMQYPLNPEYFFQIIFDYDNYDDLEPLKSKDWECRLDPFSDYRAGFELRTYRLCRKILLVHNFKELSFSDKVHPYVVKALHLDYKHFKSSNTNNNVETDFITSIQLRGYRKNEDGTYEKQSLPAVEFEYNQIAWNTEVKKVLPEDFAGAPIGLNNSYQWIDYYNEGIAGILTEQGEAWHYKSNLGEGKFDFVKTIGIKPSLIGISSRALKIQDLDASGKKYVVCNDRNLKGYYEQNDEEKWLPFKTFEQFPNVDFEDRNVKFLDLNGDGVPEIIVSDDEVFTWYESKGKSGYGEAEFFRKPLDEERGPRIVFSDRNQCVFLADMSGDGLTDIVRIGNGEICYWPNLGYGNFGSKVNMDNAPKFDSPDFFDASFLQVADISGTGPSDIVYLGRGKFKAYINLSGNAWSEAIEIAPFLPLDSFDKVSVLDFLGNGTCSIVWSSTLSRFSESPLRYIDLMGGKKPYILAGYKNNLGKEVNFEYKSSTYFYLKDKAEGNKWITKLPFPVQCVSKVTVNEKVSDCCFINEYSYHHGYYDHEEREFRGFGRVEQKDTETYSSFIRNNTSNVVEEELHQPPILTKTWYHTGSYFNNEKILKQYNEEYFKKSSFTEYNMPQGKMDSNLSAEEIAEAYRSCKGMVLRQEVYALDGSEKEGLPYSVAEHNCNIKLLQPRKDNRHSVFMVSESESITYHFERILEDPRIEHNFNIETDQWGNILKSLSVAYPREKQDNSLPDYVQDEQSRINIILKENNYTNDIISENEYKLRMPYENITYELREVSKASKYYTFEELVNFINNAESDSAKILLKHSRSLYYKNDLSTVLPIGNLDSLALIYKTYKLAFDNYMINDIFQGKVVEDMLKDGKYVLSKNLKDEGIFNDSDNDDQWWIASGYSSYPQNPEQHFYLPDKYYDSFGYETKIKYYSDYHLFISEVETALGNVTSVENFDFRFLQPSLIRDINNNYSEAKFNTLGLVEAMVLKEKGNEGDNFEGFNEFLSKEEIDNFFSDPVSYGRDLLKNATQRYVYDFIKIPVVAASIRREVHFKEENEASDIQLSFEYSNGFGSAIMKKLQAKPGKVKKLDENNNLIEVDTGEDLRWVGSGRTVFNNKGKVVKQYEPFFSSTFQYEEDKELVETGITSVMFYDPLGRLIKTEYPNGTFSKVEFDNWKQTTFDAQDTVLDSDWYNRRINGDLSSDSNEKDAAVKAAIHYNTPDIEHFDSMGRNVYKISRNKYINWRNDETISEKLCVFTKLDIEGNTLFIKDARGNMVISYKQDMLGNVFYQNSMDSGESYIFNDSKGNIQCSWDAKGTYINYLYDKEYRNTEIHVTELGKNKVISKKAVYGESTANPEANNLRGQIVKEYDGAGIVSNELFDFKGNLIKSSRQICSNCNNTIDWSNISSVSMEDKIYSVTKSYDALNRVIELNTSDGSITKYKYDQSSLLSQVIVNIKGTGDKFAVKNIDYNEKGQRLNVVYGNNAKTDYEYDIYTFRVKSVTTVRDTNDILQALNYTYDAAGNITKVIDKAQQKIYFDGAVVLQENDYTYDALYRLIKASGREHEGQNSVPNEYDKYRKFNSHPNDGSKMRNYTEYYSYDLAGNMIEMAHRTGGDTSKNWTKIFTYKDNSNVLVSTQIGSKLPQNYSFDKNGNIIDMPHLSSLNWDYDNRIISIDRSTANQDTDFNSSFYAYDSNGERVRKLSCYPNNIKKERIYLQGVEIYREMQDSEVKLIRETLHVTDGKSSIVVIDTKIKDDEYIENLKPLIRYQLSNNISSVAIELDEEAEVISYEEYYPFGNTSYEATRNSGVEVPEKRYKYAGKERDGESGFYYHKARYFAPWLARWISCDPAGFVDGLNVYLYCLNCPVKLQDPSGTGSEDNQFQLQEPTILNRKSPDQLMLERVSSAMSPGQLKMHSDPEPKFDYTETPTLNSEDEEEHKSEHSTKALDVKAKLDILSLKLSINIENTLKFNICTSAEVSYRFQSIRSDAIIKYSYGSTISGSFNSPYAGATFEYTPKKKEDGKETPAVYGGSVYLALGSNNKLTFSGNSQGNLGAAFTGGGFNANLGGNINYGNLSLSLSYGGKIDSMLPSNLYFSNFIKPLSNEYQNISNMGTSLTSMVGSIPRVLDNISSVGDYYKNNKENIKNGIDSMGRIGSIPRTNPKPQVRAGFDFSYNPNLSDPSKLNPGMPLGLYFGAGLQIAY